jgi:hypothetical protein
LQPPAVGTNPRRNTRSSNLVTLQACDVREGIKQIASTSNPAGSNPRNSLPISKGLPDWRIDLYPVFAWAPIFGANASVRDPPNPLPGPAPSGNVSGSFNGAAFAGFAIERSKWSAAGNMLWAGLSGQRQTPFVRIDTNFIYGQFMLGREVLPHLFAEARFRRTAIKIAVTVSTFPQVTWKPGIWDPLVGLTYRRPLDQKWQFRIHGDGGGFVVGNDASISATAAAEWHFARHSNCCLVMECFTFGTRAPSQGSRLKSKRPSMARCSDLDSTSDALRSVRKDRKKVFAITNHTFHFPRVLAPGYYSCITYARSVRGCRVRT